MGGWASGQRACERSYLTGLDLTPGVVSDICSHLDGFSRTQLGMSDIRSYRCGLVPTSRVVSGTCSRARCPGGFMRGGRQSEDVVIARDSIPSCRRDDGHRTRNLGSIPRCRRDDGHRTRRILGSIPSCRRDDGHRTRNLGSIPSRRRDDGHRTRNLGSIPVCRRDDGNGAVTWGLLPDRRPATLRHVWPNPPNHFPSLQSLNPPFPPPSPATEKPWRADRVKGGARGAMRRVAAPLRTRP